MDETLCPCRDVGVLSNGQSLVDPLLKTHLLLSGEQLYELIRAMVGMKEGGGGDGVTISISFPAKTTVGQLI